MDNFNWWTGFVFPYINFFIFFALAIKVFNKPLKAQFTAKQNEYLAKSKAAKQSLESARDRHDQLKRELLSVDSVVNDIAAKAESAANAQSSAILDGARKVVKQLEIESKQSGLSLEAELVERLRADVSCALLDAASKGLKERMTEVLQARVVDDRIGRVQSKLI